MQSINSVETYTYGMRKDLVTGKKQVKWNKMIKQDKMITFDYVTKEKIKEHNPNWPQISDYPYRMLIIGGSVSGKINSLFNLISQQPNIDKIYLYAKDSYEAKHQFLINKREKNRLKTFEWF